MLPSLKGSSEAITNFLAEIKKIRKNTEMEKSLYYNFDFEENKPKELTNHHSGQFVNEHQFIWSKVKQDQNTSQDNEGQNFMPNDNEESPQNHPNESY